MTRARALKQVIRARAAKTGERYTTARRHILRELTLRANDAPTGSSRQAKSLQAKSAASPALPPAPARAKGGLSDAKAIEKTGHDLAYWFDVLDRFGGIEKGHTASASFLYKQHELPGWYCQGIVVAYERARGKRVMNQRCDGAFEVSVSKVIAAKTPAIVKAITGAKTRRKWSVGADATLVTALESGLEDPKSKGFITRPDGQARFRFKWNETTVQINLYPKGPGKTSIVAQQMKLRNVDAVERYRGLWKTAFALLAAAVSTTA
jgi:hypothetical protein